MCLGWTRLYRICKIERWKGLDKASSCLKGPRGRWFTMVHPSVGFDPKRDVQAKIKLSIQVRVGAKRPLLFSGGLWFVFAVLPD